MLNLNFSKINLKAASGIKQAIISLQKIILLGLSLLFLSLIGASLYEHEFNDNLLVCTIAMFGVIVLPIRLSRILASFFSISVALLLYAQISYEDAIFSIYLSVFVLLMFIGMTLLIFLYNKAKKVKFSVKNILISNLFFVIAMGVWSFVLGCITFLDLFLLEGMMLLKILDTFAPLIFEDKEKLVKALMVLYGVSIMIFYIVFQLDKFPFIKDYSTKRIIYDSKEGEVVVDSELDKDHLTI